MLDVLTCAVPAHSATYVSTPITTGRRFVQWRRGDGSGLDSATDEYRASRERHVIRPNIEQVAPVVSELRAVNGAIVIDPTRLLDHPTWQQTDYHRLWVEIIALFAKDVVFADGWEYSQGCVFEFSQARLSGIATFDQRMTRLTADGARGLLESARVDLRADDVLPCDAIIGALQVFDAASS